MTASQQGSRSSPAWRLPAFLVIMAVAALVAPAIAYGGFLVNMATVTFSETTGSLTATTPQSSVSSVTVYNYMAMKAGGTFQTSDQSTTAFEVAKITINLTLTTPSGTNVAVAVSNIQGGIGTRTHTLILGPGEGVRESGTFTLTVKISVDITTPAGVSVSSLSLTMEKSFTVS